MEDLTDLLWTGPKEILDSQGNKYIEYQTKALDGFADGILIFYDKNRHLFTEDGAIIDEYVMQNDINQESEKSFYRFCDSVVKGWFCNVTQDGELVCKDQSKMGLIEIIQAATVIIAVNTYSSAWEKWIKEN